MFIPQLLCVSLSWTFRLVFLFMFIWLIFCFTLRVFFLCRWNLCFLSVLSRSSVNICCWLCVCVYMALSSFWSLCHLCCSVYVPGSGCLSSPPFLLFVFWGFSTVFGCTARFKFAPSASCILSLLMISSQSYIVTPTCLINTHILLKLQSISLLHRLR